jgi:hypothetical protein
VEYYWKKNINDIIENIKKINFIEHSEIIFKIGDKDEDGVAILEKYLKEVKIKNLSMSIKK